MSPKLIEMSEGNGSVADSDTDGGSDEASKDDESSGGGGKELSDEEENCGGGGGGGGKSSSGDGLFGFSDCSNCDDGDNTGF